MTDSYPDFIASKTSQLAPAGFDPETLSDHLFPFQRDIVRWALRRGKGAIFADTGLGKTPMMLEWAKHVAARTGKPVLILAPLAVAKQTAREGAKFGIAVEYMREYEPGPSIVVTNYERLDKFPVWVSPVQSTRKWPLTGWLMKSLMDRRVLTWDTVAEAKEWLQNAVTWWDTKYEIKPYTS